ncbi:MAG: UDP-2,3-diacylglucosamine diphosphatase [Methylotenera sp.]|uniref:UDP-2,3-diacylglucosamine diphosphatase n=1 Tax=Methylotenera sp. TaxID=2051956 RepID=UPI0027221462|nr:UDP-2,3-diacylglucosamine diphosphatase [Methylotenera sp.]MDO9151447.1 UDP-2,3-diacylglucosamine diphosphatase [Methylotenera sp.]
MANHKVNSPNLSETTIFISDLHLCASRPQITEAFLTFLNTQAKSAHALYILGDLFEYWAGDDDIEDAFNKQIIQGFKTLAASGVSIYLMHGNRDFLITDDFCKAAGIHLISDPTLINLYGSTALLSHGDELCTDDVAYQQFRLQVRNKQWQSEFLNQPLQARKNQIEAIRLRSEQEKSSKSAQIMDVNQDAVVSLLKAHHYPDLLIHGHTHRPNQHQVSVDGKSITRWVLGDWYEQGSYLVCDAFGYKNVNLNSN